MGNLQQLQAMHDLAENVAKAQQLLDMAHKLLADAAVEADRLRRIDAGARVSHHTHGELRLAARSAGQAKRDAETARMHVNTDRAVTR